MSPLSDSKAFTEDFNSIFMGCPEAESIFVDEDDLEEDDCGSMKCTPAVTMKQRPLSI